MFAAMTCDAHYLLKGAALALEQSGLLMRDANHLYRLRSYATCIAVAAHAHEEMGRYEILSRLWRRALAGEAFTVGGIRNACSDHVEKQREGRLAITFTDDGGQGTDLGKLIRAIVAAKPQSPEQEKLLVEFDEMIAEVKQNIPSDRHKTRMLAIYVEPKSETGWHRPADITASKARAFLLNLGSDYSMQHHRYTMRSNVEDYRQLYDALEPWPERPTLVPPEWPLPE
jgi:AbiV family abortive infection protein